MLHGCAELQDVKQEYFETLLECSYHTTKLNFYVHKSIVVAEL